MRILGITNFFDEIFILEKKDIQKPSDYIFNKIKKMKFEKYIFVGDDPINDIEPALKHGFFTYRVIRGFFKKEISQSKAHIEYKDLNKLNYLIEIGVKNE